MHVRTISGPKHLCTIFITHKDASPSTNQGGTRKIKQPKKKPNGRRSSLRLKPQTPADTRPKLKPKKAKKKQNTPPLGRHLSNTCSPASLRENFKKAPQEKTHQKRAWHHNGPSSKSRSFVAITVVPMYRFYPAKQMSRCPPGQPVVCKDSSHSTEVPQ
jgi:hypothetical protein